MSDIFLKMLPDDFDAEDEMDVLFSQLEKFEPPADMVDRIMGAVLELPQPYWGYEVETLMVEIPRKQSSKG